MADTRTDGSERKLTLRELEERAKRSTSKDLAGAASKAIRDLGRQRQIPEEHWDQLAVSEDVAMAITKPQGAEPSLLRECYSEHAQAG